MKAMRQLLVLLTFGLAVVNSGRAAGLSDFELKVWRHLHDEGVAALGRQNLIEAIRNLFAALELAERLGPADERLAETLRHCGWSQMALNLPAGAEELFRQALVVRLVTQGADHRDTAQTCLELADALTSQAKYTEAEEYLDRARRGFEKAWGNSNPAVGQCLAIQARLKAGQGLPAEAEQLFKKALRLTSSSSDIVRRDPATHAMTGRITLSASKLTVAGIQSELAQLYLATGRTAEAAEAFQKAIELIEAQQGKEGPALPAALVALAEARMELNDFPAAATLIDRAIKLGDRLFGPEHFATITARSRLLKLLIVQEKWDAEEVKRVVLPAGPAPSPPPMTEEWLPFIEAMITAGEKPGNEQKAERRRARIAEIKRLQAIQSLSAQKQRPLRPRERGPAEEEE